MSLVEDLSSPRADLEVPVILDAAAPPMGVAVEGSSWVIKLKRPSLEVEVLRPKFLLLLVDVVRSL
jgi:hypothetical protein